MALTNKQKNYIKKQYKKSSPEQVAKHLNLTKKSVVEFIKTLQKPKPKKIYYAILVLIPILFFVVLEISLRAFGYGIDTNTWVNTGNGKLGLNPEFARRYFYNVKNVPRSIQDVFDKAKKENSYRVFVLGGSSAAGYPFMPLGSFSRYIQKRLEIFYPDKTIEVVNVALTAVNSYTIRDLIPDVIEQKPDLILIYAGHNEYYGALGVGSMESLGTSRSMVNLILKLNKFKTIELLRNTIQALMKLFNGHEKKTTGTLMARMAQKQSIPLNSEIYSLGLSQFEGNMRDVLKSITQNKIPVIISNLVSNLKDQPPFISNKFNSIPSAKIVYNSAKEKLHGNKLKSAAKLFRYAKDLDLLRFRAPEGINKIILKLANQFAISIINVDSLFNELSPYHIVGNNLITDHLHPKLKGYQLIGRLFYEKMEKENYLPDQRKIDKSNLFQDSLTVANYPFSKLDSVIADYKIKLLKNDWPFVNQYSKKRTSELFTPENFIDSTALKFIYKKKKWLDAEKSVAEWYIKHKDYKDFKKQMNVILSQYPSMLNNYNYVAEILLKKKRFDEALEYLKSRYYLKPDAFSTKWMGTVLLSKNKVDEAIKYLTESLSFNPKDEQVLYNLAGAYSLKKNYRKASELINGCLQINPDYKEAKVLKEQLLKAVSRK